MKIETMRDQVRTVAARWKEAYQTQNLPYYFDKAEIQRKLDALDVETATDKDVATTIGNGTWVSPGYCGECKTEDWSAIQLGEEPDYESATATICLACLRKAVEMVEKDIGK